MKFLPFLLILMINASAAEWHKAKFEDRLPYALNQPKVAEGTKLPLVLFLHGAGERGDDNQSQMRHGAGVLAGEAVQKSHPCFVLAPQCPKGAWWKGRTLNDALKLLKEKITALPIDPDRVYITGLSMGGFGTWGALALEPTLFAAAMPICGGGDPSTVGKFKQLPIRAFHGEADEVVKPDQSERMVDALKKAGSRSVELTLYPGVKHDSWTRTYADLEVIKWLFTQKK